MRRRALPGMSREVSEIGLSVSNLSIPWWGTSEPGRVERLVLQAFDRDVTLFETADVAGEGGTERVLGRALRTHRWEVTLVTKVGYDFVGSTRPGFLESAGRQPGGVEARHAGASARPRDAERAQDFRPEAIRRACEASLRRLGTEVIDLYELHHPRLDALDQEAVWDVLEVLRREGKIAGFGVCLGPGPGWVEEAEAALHRPGCRILEVSADPLAGFPERIRAAAASAQAALLVRDVHRSGLFGGPPPPPEADTAGGEEGTGEACPRELLGQARGRLGEGGLTGGRPNAEAAAAWALSFSSVASVLVRARTEAELKEVLAAGETPPLSAEERDRLVERVEEAFGRLPRLLPGSSAIRPTPAGSRIRE